MSFDIGHISCFSGQLPLPPPPVVLRSGVSSVTNSATFMDAAVCSSTLQGVPRAHVVPPTSGALLEEIYTRDGAGLLISRDM